jgi:hypothetical protein
MVMNLSFPHFGAKEFWLRQDPRFQFLNMVSSKTSSWRSWADHGVTLMDSFTLMQ